MILKFWLSLSSSRWRPRWPGSRYQVISNAHLPFLMVFRPSTGSSTGSIDSSMFSISTVSPDEMAFSITSKYPRWPMRMTRRSSPYFCLIHLMPWSWGSIMSGQRWQLERMVAFSVDMRSLGSPSLFQPAMEASSVSRVSGSSPSVMGMGF